VLGGAYGPVFEQWFDGANGEGPNGKKQVYDWPLFNGTVLKNQPQAVIFSDVGPGCRWVGNEEGHAGRTNWGTLNVEGFTPGAGGPSHESLNEGDVYGTHWVPAETDVSIRPGWFWRESENDQVKSVNQLLKIYYESVGRNSLLLLNVPPDTRGHLHEIDSTRLMEFRSALDQIFAENLAIGQKRHGREWTVKVNPEKPFNRVVLTEDIAKGQRVASFIVEARTADGWEQLAEESTIGHKRILLVPETTTGELRVTVTDALAKPLLGAIGLYYDPIYTE
jgi:alpha-L-fucosidase